MSLPPAMPQFHLRAGCRKESSTTQQTGRGCTFLGTPGKALLQPHGCPAWLLPCLAFWRAQWVGVRALGQALHGQRGPDPHSEKALSCPVSQAQPQTPRPGGTPKLIVVVNFNRPFGLFLVSSAKKKKNTTTNKTKNPLINLDDSCLPLGSLHFARFPPSSSASLACACSD